MEELYLERQGASEDQNFEDKLTLSKSDSSSCFDIFDELVRQQEEKLYKFGQKIIPHLTKEDILQPNDFPALENHPLFRYEEGILEGLQTARMAFLAVEKNRQDG